MTHKKMIKRIIIWTLIVVMITSVAIGVLSYLSHTRQQISGLKNDIALYDKVIASETDWLLQTSLSNGALAFYPVIDGEAYINPGFCEYTALALITDSQDARTQKVVKDYIVWHFEHLNAYASDSNGLLYTIFDYTADVQDGIVTGESTEGVYDAADSYAAFFLHVLWTYYQQTGDKALLTGNYEAITGITRMLISLQQSHGLMYTSPGYPVCYLMDNCEVYTGLQSAQRLYSDLFVPEGNAEAEKLDREIQQSLDALTSGIEDVLWNNSGYYESSVQGEDYFSDFSWAEMYPSAMAQLFPIIFGVVDTTNRAQSLYTQFCATYDWQHMAHYTVGSSDFYTSIIAWASAVIKDYDRLNQYLSVYIFLTQDGHAYPAYNADAACVLLACKQAKASCLQEMDRIDPLYLYHSK